MPVDPLTAAAIISGGAAVGGTLINHIGGVRAQEVANEGNMRLAEYQNTQNQLMWSLNNLYNHPTAQMSRLKQAGLNPNLIYGTGTVSGNTSGAPPRMERAELKPEWVGIDLPDIMNIVTNLMSTKKDQAQIDLIERNESLLKVREVNEFLRGEGQKLSNKQKSNILKYQAAMLEEELKTKAYRTDQEKVKLSDMELENQVNKLLKKYNLNSKDSAIIRFMLSQGMDEGIIPIIFGKARAKTFKEDNKKERKRVMETAPHNLFK